ncbi:hypothetical protein CC86DRAFT_42367 [Ophiobolus disseminans]|uniref:Uncharacterized protein n=1 Tax=Ophiobolus disseminans TaxID=1469910 RepID=A0A6A6ZXS8_9PLEO|nr:hypothetical protein CC86DRAFT_42367 [Ophiobolus disseminans]
MTTDEDRELDELAFSACASATATPPLSDNTSTAEPGAAGRDRARDLSTSRRPQWLGPRGLRSGRHGGAGGRASDNKTPAVAKTKSERESSSWTACKQIGPLTHFCMPAHTRRPTLPTTRPNNSTVHRTQRAPTRRDRRGKHASPCHACPSSSDGKPAHLFTAGKQRGPKRQESGGTMERKTTLTEGLITHRRGRRRTCLERRESDGLFHGKITLYAPRRILDLP